MSLPLLPRTPSCTEDFDSMERRAGGRRFCGKCAREVHDFTRLTRAEALAIKQSVGGRLCVRMKLDDQGAPLFKEPRRPARERVQGLVLAAALVAGGSASAAGASGCARSGGASEEATLVSEPPSLGAAVEGAAAEEGAKSEEERADTLAQLEAAQLAAGQPQMTVLSEPMRPIGPGEAVSMPPLEEPQLFASLTSEAAAGQPTAEQRALTRRKQSQQSIQSSQLAAVLANHHQQVWMGGI